MVDKSLSQKISKGIIMVLLSIAAILAILPFIHIIAVSFSGMQAAEANLVSFWPVNLDFQAWQQVLTDERMWKAMGVSLLRIVLGGGLTLLISVPAAYVLSVEKNEFPARTKYVGFLLVPMFFSGGIIPSYILMKQLNLLSTIWALVLPGTAAMSVLILLLNFFRTIPKEIREAAKLDGGNDLQMLIYVYLPLGMPCIITVAMFSLINHWNAWFDGVVYMRDVTKYPLQTYVYSAIQSLVSLSMGQETIVEGPTVAKASLKAAYTVIATLPVVCVYPLLQRYVKDGLVIGSVKG